MATTLGSKSVGSIVKLKVDGTLRNFIVVHQGLPGSMYDASCDGTWLLMEDCYESRIWSSKGVSFYGDSEINNYLNNTFILLFDTNIRAAIKQVSPPGAPTVKVFLLSCFEIGFTNSYSSGMPNSGTRLDYFPYYSDDRSKLIAYLNGSPITWWTRSLRVGSSSPYAIYPSPMANDVNPNQAFGIRPALILPFSVYVSDDGFVYTNTTPTTPSSITVPSSIMGGSTITLSWGASTDAEDNLSGYKVEKSVNGGSSWSQIYQGTARQTTDQVVFGTASVMYRVRAYDAEGEHSGYKTSSQVTVVNNVAPGAPHSVTVPSEVKGGASLTVSWAAATDSDGNLEGYSLERKADGGAWKEIYKGSALSYTDSITKGWATVEYRVRAYDTLGAYGGYTSSPARTVDNNTAPSVPANIQVPETINGGEAITISWSAATDEEDNLAGYELERSTDGGTTWVRVYQGGNTNTPNTVPFGSPSAAYRVRAYDTLGLYSGYRTSPQSTVINNVPPSVPSGIYVPEYVKGGGKITVTWGYATDTDGNLSGYRLERRVGEGSWEQIYAGEDLSYTDAITKGWTDVAYRVRAVDSLNAVSDWQTSPVRTVDNNTPPEITCALSGDLGVKTAGFAVSYTVSDPDGDAVTVTEAVDGAVKRTFQAGSGENSFPVTGEAFMTLLNGEHTLTIAASDGKGSASHSLTFSKSVTAAEITLAQPMDADGPITLGVLSVTGNIPQDADYKVEVTNNGKDSAPVWEECTNAVKGGLNHVFENTAAENGFAFNFRVTVSRGESGQGGYITSIQGGFQ